MPEDKWQPGKRKDIARLAREVEGNINHPNRFAAQGGTASSSELEQRRLKEMVGRFSPDVAEGQQTGQMSADFTSSPLLDKLLRPVFPDMADAIKNHQVHDAVEYPRNSGKESNVSLTQSQFLKLAAQHGYNPSLKLEMTDALAEEWRILGGSGQARG
jgi:hypothetical protein